MVSRISSSGLPAAVASPPPPSCRPHGGPRRSRRGRPSHLCHSHRRRSLRPSATTAGPLLAPARLSHLVAQLLALVHVELPGVGELLAVHRGRRTGGRGLGKGARPACGPGAGDRGQGRQQTIFLMARPPCGPGPRCRRASSQSRVRQGLRAGKVFVRRVKVTILYERLTRAGSRTGASSESQWDAVWSRSASKTRKRPPGRPKATTVPGRSAGRSSRRARGRAAWPSPRSFTC